MQYYASPSMDHPANLKKANPPRRAASNPSVSRKTFAKTLTGAISSTNPPASIVTMARSNSSTSLSTLSSEASSDNGSSPFRPTANATVNATAVWSHATMKGWLTKHIPPAYSFTKNRKQRFVVLVDRFVYVFKTEEPNPHFREFMELTKDCKVFVTDQFSGVMYCIEIRKPGIESKSWYLQAENVEVMKAWLDRLKKTVQWLQLGLSGTITTDVLNGILSENDVLLHGGSIIPDDPSSFLPTVAQQSLPRHNYNSSNDAKRTAKSSAPAKQEPVVEYHAVTCMDETQDYMYGYSSMFSVPTPLYEQSTTSNSQHYSSPHPLHHPIEPRRRHSTYPYRDIHDLPRRPPPPTSALPPLPPS